MPDNQYQVVASPNYAQPLLDFSALNPYAPKNQKPQQGQQNQQPGQPQQGQQSGQGIPNFARGLQQFFQPQQQQSNGPQAYQQPGMPIQLGPGSVAGANQMFSGVY